MVGVRVCVVCASTERFSVRVIRLRIDGKTMLFNRAKKKKKRSEFLDWEADAPQ